MAEINSMIRQNRQPSFDDVKKYKNKADQLLRTEFPEAGWLLHAIIAGSIWDIERLHHYADRALSCATQTATWLNVIVAYSAANEFNHALHVAERAHAAYPGDGHVLYKLLEAHTVLGSWDEGVSIGTDFVARFGDASSASSVIEKWVETKRKYIRMLHLAGVETSQLKRELGISRKVLSNHKISHDRMVLDSLVDDEGVVIFIALKLVLARQRVRELAKELVDELSADNSWDPGKLNVDFRFLAFEAAYESS